MFSPCELLNLITIFCMFLNFFSRYLMPSVFSDYPNHLDFICKRRLCCSFYGLDPRKVQHTEFNPWTLNSSWKSTPWLEKSRGGKKPDKGFRFSPEQLPYIFFCSPTLNFSTMRLLSFLLPFRVSKMIYLYPLDENKQADEQKAAWLSTGHFASQILWALHRRAHHSPRVPPVLN